MPPAAGNSTVQISIQVVDVNSGQVISTTTKNLNTLGTAGAKAGTQVAAGLNAVGAAGTEAGRKVGKGFDEMASHSLRPIDNVRLFRDDLGIRIPRAMEMVIAKSGVLSKALGAIGGGLVGLGAAELLFHIGEEAYHLYERLQDVNAEMRKYSLQAGQNAVQKLFDTQSIEEVNALLKQTNDQLRQSQAMMNSAGVNEANQGSFRQYATVVDRSSTAGGGSFDGAGRFVSGITNMMGGHSAPLYTATDDAERARLTEQNTILVERKQAIDAKRAVDQAEAKASIDGMRLTGYAANAAAAENSRQLALLRQTQAKRDAELQRDVVKQNNDLIRRQNPGQSDEDLREKGLRAVPVVAGDLGSQDAADAIAKANAEAGAKSVAMARKENDEIERLRGEARSAGLQGEAKYRAQLQATLDGFQRRVRDSELSGAAAHQMALAVKEKADREYQERRRAEAAETTRIQSEAAGAGLTGIAKQDAELKARMDAIAKEAPGYARGDTRGNREAAARSASLASQQKEIDAFRDHIAQMDDSRSNSSMSANQRIDAETRRTVAEITKTWNDLYGQLAVNDARRVQGQMALNAELEKINAAAAKQKQENTLTLEQETRKAEDEAARSGLPRYQEQGRAIVDEYRERYEQLERLRANDAEHDELYRRQEIAAEQVKNGKLLDQRRELRDKLAGELRGFFSNPLEALKRQGEDMASKAAADLILGNVPGGIGSGRGGGLGDLFRPTFKRNGGFPGFESAGHGSASTSTQQAVVTAASAVINVGSASFNAAGSPSSAVGAIAGGGYASMGNGGFFNLGSGSSEMGSAAATIASASGGGGGLSTEMPDLSGFGVSDADGNPTSILAASGSASKDLGILGKVPGLGNMGQAGLGKLGGTFGGAMGVFSAFEGKGGWGGALSGALSGAQMGAQFGGPIGAAIGAAAGGLLGFMGHGARVEAQKYYYKELQPKIAQEMLGFEAGTADYQSVYDDLNSSSLDAKNRTRQMGPGAVDYYNERIKPEIDAYMARLTREQNSGRAQFGMTGAQFHGGGMIGDFGSFATSPTEGFIHAERGEIMLNQQAAMSHPDVAMLMNAGLSRSGLADYLGGGGDSRMPVESGGDVHLHVHTMDARGVRDFLGTYKHDVRAAVNQSYAENSGGSDL